jgi:hypothetical protein
MAIIGVLLALTSALVGGQRTELIATMVEQTNTGAKYQAISTKYRVLLAQLKQLDSLNPDPELFKKWDEEARKLGSEMSSADMTRLAKIIRLENAKNLNAEIPTHEDMVAFTKVIRSLDEEKDAASEWTESYEGAIKAHSTAAEHYEWAQLASEIGIVIASIALLFMSRAAWTASVILGCATVVIAGFTFVSVSSQLHGAEEKITTASAHFESLGGDKKDKVADEELLKSMEESKSAVVDPDTVQK